jgi:DNA-binding CsgD family transcriptional regulator
LDAFVQITLASGDVAAARSAATEISEIARRHGARFLRAMAGRAMGAVLLAEHDARGALKLLRQSWMTWRELQAPYEAARTRVLLALACRDLGDDDAANMEIAAAQEVFQRLSAAADLSGLQRLSTERPASAAGLLTAREAEVLKLVAAGFTNRRLADKLRISEKTVARHLSNIFTKLNISSRTAATAYAFKNNLV